MAATSEGGEALSSDWYEKLFDSGMFSDVTIRFGGTPLSHQHERKVHFSVLSKKCEWFAARCEMGEHSLFANEWKTENKIIFEKGITPEIADVGLVPCADSCQQNIDCNSWTLFLALMKFCYTGNYVECLDFTKYDSREKAAINIYMYMLGKRYGVKDILDDAINGFTDEIQGLRNLGQGAVIQYINIIYKLPGLDEDDLLRTIALNEAKQVADAASVPITQKLLQTEAEKHIKELMPAASKHLFESGYTVFDVNKNPTCFRCYEPLGLEEDSKPAQTLCDFCLHAHYSQRLAVPFPTNAINGYSIALWQCQYCSVRWTCEGIRTRAVVMKECPCCAVNGLKLEASEVDGWVCEQCGMIWGTSSTKGKDALPLEVCICCPKILG